MAETLSFGVRTVLFCKPAVPYTQYGVDNPKALSAAFLVATKNAPSNAVGIFLPGPIQAKPSALTPEIIEWPWDVVVESFATSGQVAACAQVNPIIAHTVQAGFTTYFNNVFAFPIILIISTVRLSVAHQSNYIC
jgi:hypothetical protein